METTVEKPEVSSLEGIKPMSEFNPVKPENGVKYIPDEEYEKLKTPVQAESSVVETPATKETKEPTAFDPDNWIKEKTGGKFEKWEALESFINEPVKFENEDSKTLYEYIQAGKIDELGLFLTQQRILSGVSDMPSADVIKLQMRIDDPEATEDDIEDDFQRKFPEPDYAGMDEKEAEKAKRRYERSLNAEGKTARERLLAMKKEIKLAELPKKQETVIKPEQVQQELQQANQRIAESVNKALETFSKLNFKVEDKQQGVAMDLEFDVTSEDKAVLKKSSQDFFGDIEATYGQGDQFNGEKYARDKFILNNLDKIIKSAAISAYNKGKLDKTMNVANVNLNPEAAPAIDMKAQQDEAAKRRFIRGY